jgi:hypothetical protein
LKVKANKRDMTFMMYSLDLYILSNDLEDPFHEIEFSRKKRAESLDSRITKISEWLRGILV